MKGYEFIVAGISYGGILAIQEYVLKVPISSIGVGLGMIIAGLIIIIYEKATADNTDFKTAKPKLKHS